MIRSNKHYTQHAGTLAGTVVTSFLLLACATAPTSPPGAAETRQKLSALQNDTKLAGRAQFELRSRNRGEFCRAAGAELQRQIDVLEAQATDRWG